MSSGLDPVILEKLESFSQRRRKLIILRGVFAALAMLLAAMMLVALVDYLFVLPDWVRWSLSGLAYLAVIITEWRACLRLLVHAPDPRQLARLIEHAEPKLREDLISAVELGQSSASYDSKEFRRLVQEDVASRVEGINMEKLLPVQLLRRTIVLAGISTAAFVIIFAASGFQFGTLFIRAMLPMANLARVSKVKVNIVEPNPAEAVVPQGDSVPLVIEITGQRTSKAVLETFTPGGGREIIPMTASGPDRFAANIQVAREDIAYRVRAGDALTRKYQLHAAARPHVVRFHKTYRFPNYVKLAERQITEENGDLAALEGTQVTLQVETDQPVKTAELRIDQGKQSGAIPLRPGADGKFSAQIPINASGYYRIHLVAAETGFENKFSPEYEIRPDADLVPQIELELPRHDLMLPSNEVVDLRGTATDDYGIAKVAQLIRINDGAWKEVPLNVPEGKQVTAERRWDLYEQGVRPGDLLTTKLLAVDLKGSRAESRPVQITVTSSGFESRRMTSLEDQRQLLVALKTLRTAAETLEKRANESREQIDRLGENDPQRKQALASFAGALDDFERAAAAAGTQLQTALRGATPGHTTGEFVMLGRLLARMWGGAEQNARDAVNVAVSNETLPSVRDLIRDAADSSSRAAQRARLAEESARVFVTSEAIDVLNESTEVVSREQERISTLAGDADEDAAKWAQLVSRLRVVMTQAKGLGEVMSATAEHATDGFGDRLRRLQKEFDKQRTILERTLDTGAASKELLEPVTKFAKAMNDFRRGAFDMKRDYMHPPARAFQTMLQEAQPTWANFEKLRQESDNLARNERLPEAQRGQLLRARWEAKSAILKMHGDAEEVRPDSDAYFVGDVRATTLALGGLREPLLAGNKPFSDAGKATAFVTLDKAFRLLESAHNLAEAHEALISLTTAERWEVSAFRARTANPRDWEWLEARLKALPDELGKTQLNEEPVRKAIQAAQKILWEAQRDSASRTVNEEMKQRLRSEASPRAMPQEAEHLAAFVQQALDLLREPVLAARKTIAQMAPTLSDMAAQLARKAEKLQQQTAEHAAKSTEKSPDQAHADAQQQLAQQQQLNRDLDALKDLLRSDANKQNLLDKEGRERARDADDALAMLKEPPPKAEEALAEAAAHTEGADQQPALEKAATEQGKLADALKQVSQHYDALEQGNTEQTRLALREAEKNLGAKDELDQRYARAEQLAQITQATPEEMLKQLEKALPQNPLMQQELSGISKNVLKSAGEKLADASQRESSISQQIQKLAADQAAQAQAQATQAAQNNATQSPPEGNQPPDPQNPPTVSAETSKNGQTAPQDNPSAQQSTPALPQPAGNAQANVPNPEAPTTQAQPPAPQNPQLTQAANQQTPIAQAANDAGLDVARAGRHEQRLQNTATGQKLERLGEEIRETGNTDVRAAQQALQNSQMAEQAKAPVAAAQSELQSELGELNKVQTGDLSDPQPQNASAQQALQQNQAASGQQQPMQAQNSSQAPPNAQQPAQSGANMQQPTAQAQNGQQPAKAQSGQQQQNQQAQASKTPQQGSTSGQEPGEMAMPIGMSGVQIGSAPASPQEQVWMARTLDMLDTALNADGSQQQQSQQSQQGQQAQSGNQSQQGQQGKQNPDGLAKAQQAMNSAAQATATAMRASRSQQSQNMQQPNSSLAKGDLQPSSKTGATADGPNGKRGELPGAQASGKSAGDWGKLPKKVAEQLTQGQRETVAGEYRNQVETYYRVIAERAKKQ